jgi:hypothetical protein
LEPWLPVSGVLCEPASCEAISATGVANSNAVIKNFFNCFLPTWIPLQPKAYTIVGKCPDSLLKCVKSSLQLNSAPPFTFSVVPAPLETQQLASAPEFDGLQKANRVALIGDDLCLPYDGD